MILTRKQMEGLKIAVQRYKEGCKYTVISGYAGSGKSTLVKFIVDALEVNPDNICYCAFTGKAAEVLRKKGNRNVCTLHKLLYEHIPMPNGSFLRKAKDTIDYKIIVVDEVSMAPKHMMDLLMTHNVYIICLGDPFQLPPIDKDEDNGLLYHPHIFLDEIMRQAQESEIIQLTMKIRNYEAIDYMNGQEVKIISNSQLNTGILTWADQILTATNSKRQQINNIMRQLQGREGEPQDGDKMICLRNYWDSYSSDGNPLINGTIGILTNSYKTVHYIPRFIIQNEKKISSFEVLAGDLISSDSDERYSHIDMDYNMIVTGNKCCDWKLAYTLGKYRKKIGEIVPKEFTYAYAITVHKAQGSEWPKVAVLEENFPFAKEEHARWLYTACTRASDKLVLVR